MQSGFKSRAKAEADRFRLSTDSEYWFCVCFKSRAQKDAFMAGARWIEFGTDKYIDGTRLAESLGVPIPSVDL